MWVSLVQAAMVAVVVLYVPGYFFVRGLLSSRLASVACAPFATMAVYGILTAFFAKVGVFCTGALLLASATALGVAFCGAVRALSRRADSSAGGDWSGHAFGGLPEGAASKGESLALGWFGLAAYVVAGVAVALLVLVFNMESADSFVQYYDNCHHLNTIRCFIDSGNWSSFGATLYATAADAGIDPYGGGGFYPSVWHVVAASAASLVGTSAPVAQNAALVVFAAVVFPSGMYLLIRTVFPERPLTVFFGALATMAFALFPWRFITFGPLFPNLASLALLPAVCACFVALFGRGLQRRNRGCLGALFAVGMVGIAFTQPNGVFSAGVLLAPFCVVQAGRLADRLACGDKGKRIARVAICALAVALIALIWYLCFSLPFMQGVVSFNWPASLSFFQAVKNVARLVFLSFPAQIALAVAVAVGALCTLRHRTFLWLACAYLLACLMYAVNVSSDGFFKHLLTGFWYTDTYRVAACVVMAGVPLAAFGLDSLCRGASMLAGKCFAQPCRALAVLIPCLVAALFSLANYFPHYAFTGTVDDENAFDVAGKYMREAFQNAEYGCYDADERAFVAEAKAFVSSDDLVVNVPLDGSPFAYGADDLRVLFRLYSIDADESDESRIVREGLCNVGSSSTVQHALEDMGAKYVLLLDADASDQSGVCDYWDERDRWQGIWGIDEATPGFETVLSRGDMRLYRITAVD